MTAATNQQRALVPCRWLPSQQNTRGHISAVHPCTHASCYAASLKRIRNQATQVTSFKHLHTAPQPSLPSDKVSEQALFTPSESWDYVCHHMQPMTAATNQQRALVPCRWLPSQQNTRGHISAVHPCTHASCYAASLKRIRNQAAQVTSFKHLHTAPQPSLPSDKVSEQALFTARMPSESWDYVCHHMQPMTAATNQQRALESTLSLASFPAKHPWSYLCRSPMHTCLLLRYMTQRDSQPSHTSHEFQASSYSPTALSAIRQSVGTSTLHGTNAIREMGLCLSSYAAHDSCH